MVYKVLGQIWEEINLNFNIASMVMSKEPDMMGKEVDIVSKEKGQDKDRVSDKVKDLAGETISAFNRGEDYTGCLTTLEKLC